MNAPMLPLLHVTIDGRTVTVPKGTTVYQAAKQLGIDIPIFCYLDRLPPFGACRMCLVEVDKMPKLQTSCTLEVTEGMVVRTQAEAAIGGRAQIIEFLLLNHPLDCPICDRGGECPLQDHTLNHGAGKSRFYEEKRRFPKPLPLGPLLMLDRERCISCARCTRFSDLISGDHALEFIDRGDRTEVGTPGGQPIKSKFIGNTIMICPVGALTSQVYRFRARPWDNQLTETTCTLCAVGCRMVVDTRDGRVMRTRATEDRQVNDMWLCDKGWFGYEFTDHSQRLRQPLMRCGETFTTISWEKAFSVVAEQLKRGHRSGKIAGWTGTALTCEDYLSFQKLMREGLSVPHLDHRLGEVLFSLDEEGLPPGMERSIEQCEELTDILLLGLDLTEEFPVIWLRLKQALLKGARLIFIGHYAPEVMSHFNEMVLHAPGEERSALEEHLPHFVKSIEGRKGGAIFVGRQYLHSPNRQAILAYILERKQQTRHLSLHIMEGRGNSMGARFAGIHPELAPGGKRASVRGWHIGEVIHQGQQGGWDLLYVAGCNPAKRLPSTEWQHFRQRLGCLIVQDLFLTETAQQADIVLPTLSFLEKGGHFISIEGRTRVLRAVREPLDEVYSDAKIFQEIGKKLQIDASLSPEESAPLTQPFLLPLRPTQLTANWKGEEKQIPASLKATFFRPLFDQGVRMRHNPHLIQSAAASEVRIHPEEGKGRGLADGGLVTIGEAEHFCIARLKWDERVARQTLVCPVGLDEKLPVHELGMSLYSGMALQIEETFL